MRFDKKRLTIDKQKINYYQSGSGPDLVFLHGHRADALRWDGFIEGLAKYYTVYAPDLPGHGESELNFLPTMKNYARATIRFAEELNLTKPTLFGASMGGVIALEAAYLNESRFQKLILFGTPLSFRAYRINPLRLRLLQWFAQTVGSNGWTTRLLQKMVNSDRLWFYILKKFLLDEPGGEDKVSYEVERWRSSSLTIWGETFFEILTVDFTQSKPLNLMVELIYPLNDRYIHLETTTRIAESIFHNYRITKVNSPGHLPHGPMNEAFLKPYRKVFKDL